MDNQHKKIKGYRDLSPDEIDLMNRVKDHAIITGHLIEELAQIRRKQAEGNTEVEFTNTSLENLKTAKQYLQTGTMWLVRSIAMPTTF